MKIICNAIGNDGMACKFPELTGGHEMFEEMHTRIMTTGSSCAELEVLREDVD